MVDCNSVGGKGEGMPIMYETKKLRKTMPIIAPKKAGKVDLWNGHDFSHPRNSSITKRTQNDSWAELLDEPQDRAKLVYEKGTWSYIEEDMPLKETRNEIKCLDLPETRVTRFPKSGQK